MLHLLVRLLSLSVAVKLSSAFVCDFLMVLLKIIDFGHYSLGCEAFLSFETAGGELECLTCSLVWALPLECSNFFFSFWLKSLNIVKF